MLIDLKSYDLEFTIADNDLHDPHLDRWITDLADREYELPIRVSGYNGLRKLKHKDCDESIVYFAFLNLEAIGDGTIGSDGTVGSTDIHGRRAYIFYEPRRNPVTIYKLSERKAILFQNPLPHWGVESTMAIDGEEPHYLDITLSFITHRKTEDNRPILFLVPNYVLAPQEPLTNFVLETGEWSSAYPDRVTMYPCSAQQRQLLGSLDTMTLGTLAPNAVLRYPFFYGVWKNMVLAMFFDSGDSLSFACNPVLVDTWQLAAWDMQFTLENPEPYNEYVFNARLMFKPFVTREDVLDEYMTWMKQNQPEHEAHPTAC
jgi:hypothetical protein